MRGLAVRHHHVHRAKARAVRYLRWVLAGLPGAIDPRRVGRRATDRTPCSCRMCGNPRRYGGGPTRAECRAEGDDT
ncbi:MAG: hypothetical protein K2X82_15795 [Gemmataceae bacterium]|nr:hypothetical protein [Gemmataceae bacterium]